MPTASSSAMCLSRATGSRPVQPAITAWSIGSVNGVVVSWASMVKIRSNTDHGLHASGEFENAAIRSAGRCQHQADRNLAFAVRGQRDCAAVDHVDQAAIAQRTQVCRGKGLVVGEIRDL